MNKICKQYIKEIKALLPIRQKQEREYIKRLLSDVSDYCEEANVTTKQELYDNYGKPAEVVSNYLTALDTDFLIKRLKVSKVLRICAIVLIAATLISASAYCLNQYVMKEIWEKSVITGAETVIVVEEVIE